MLNQIIQQKKSPVMERFFPPGKSSIRLIEIISDDFLDDYLKNYFATEIEWAIYREHTVRESHPYFNINILTNSELSEILNKHYMENACFEKAKFEDLLDKALRLRANFLIRPNETLKNFIFVGAPSKPAIEILYKLSFFVDYQYLTGKVKDYVESLTNGSNDAVVGDSEFSNVVRENDEKYFFSLQLNDFSTLIEPIFQFMGSAYNEHIVPLAALELFFYDKNMARVAEYLNKLFSDKNREYVRKEELNETMRNLIQSLIVSQKNETTESIESYGYVTEEVSPVSEFTEPPIHTIEEYENYGDEIEIPKFGNESFDVSDIQFDKSFSDREEENAVLPLDLENNIGNLNDIEWMVSEDLGVDSSEIENLHPKFNELSSRINQKIAAYSNESKESPDMELNLNDENYFEESDGSQTTLKHQMRKTLFDLSKKLNTDLNTINEEN